MRSSPTRSGTSPDATAWASFGTISVWRTSVISIGRSGFSAFQASTRAWTMPMLPPERSHISIVPLVGLPPGSLADGWPLDGADGDAGAEPVGVPPPVHAAIATTAPTMSAGNLRRFLIPAPPCRTERRGSGRNGAPPTGHGAIYHECNRVHTFDCITCAGTWIVPPAGRWRNPRRPDCPRQLIVLTLRACRV